MNLLKKLMGANKKETETKADTIESLECKMSDLVDNIRLEDMKKVFLDIVIFEYKGEIHREGMVFSDQFAPQGTAY